MTISSSSYASQMMQQMQRKEQPSAGQITSDVFENSDSDGDGLLSTEEIGLSEETFSLMDSDGDGTLSSSELEDGISSKLQSMQSQELTPQEFGSFLSELGLEVPPPPPGGMKPDVSAMASDIFASSDGDEDGLLSIEELKISEELFASIDSDEDGKVSQEELEQKLDSMFEDLRNGDMEQSEFEETMSALGVETPAAPPSGGGMGGGAAGGSSEEEYDEADTNQDGTVSAAEYAAYYGSEETSSDAMSEYTMDLVSTLIEALKAEQTEDGNESDIELSQFKQIMSMVNEQTQDPQTKEKLDQYLSNLAS